MKIYSISSDIMYIRYIYYILWKGFLLYSNYGLTRIIDMYIVYRYCIFYIVFTKQIRSTKKTWYVTFIRKNATLIKKTM